MDRLRDLVDQVVARFSGNLSGVEGEGFEVTFQHTWPWPPWTTLVLIIGLLAFSVWLYCGGNSLPRRVRIGLGSLRFAVCALTVFLMYGWHVSRHRTDLPDLVVVLDDTQSMNFEDQFQDRLAANEAARRTKRAGLPSTSRWNQALALLTDERFGWLSTFHERYRLKMYRLGSGARPVQFDPTEGWQVRLRELRADESSSRLGLGLQRILEAQRGRPTVGVVLLTDGITTVGRDIADVAPMARRQAIPLFAVGLGDDQPVRDIRLTDLLVDDVVFVDDVVHFDVKLHHDGFAGQSVVVELVDESNAILTQQTRVLTEYEGPQPVRLSHRVSREGQRRFTVRISDLPGEANSENNAIARSVQVRDAQMRVLLVQSEPSYEYRALKNLLSRTVRSESTSNVIDLTTVLQQADFEYVDQDETAARVIPVNKEELFRFDVIILGDVNPTLFGQSVMNNLVEFVTDRGGGLVFIAGPRFTPFAFRGTPLEEVLPIDLNSTTAPSGGELLRVPRAIALTPLGRESPHLQVAAGPEGSSQAWQGLPGVYWFLTATELRPAARVLATFEPPANSAERKLPAIASQFVGAGKVILHASDETYRWSQHLGSDEYYARYWLQLIRYLSRSKLLSDGAPTEIVTDRSQYRTDDVVQIQVRFRDDRLAPSNDEGVRVMIQSSTGRRRELTLGRDSTARGEFAGFLDDLMAGSYRVFLSSPSLAQVPEAARFAVESPAGELVRLEMDSAALKEAASVSRGRYYRITEADRLPADLPRGREVRVDSLPDFPLWNSNILAVVFVLMLSAEWLLRRWVGLV